MIVNLMFNSMYILKHTLAIITLVTVRTHTRIGVVNSTAGRAVLTGVSEHSTTDSDVWRKEKEGKL